MILVEGDIVQACHVALRMMLPCNSELCVDSLHHSMITIKLASIHYASKVGASFGARPIVICMCSVLVSDAAGHVTVQIDPPR